MKRILIAVVCLLWLQAAFAQKEALAMDEHNKYIYYQVVDRPGAGLDSLQTKVLGFIKETYPKIKFSQRDTAISIEDKFLTYSALAFAKHESGEIRYTFTIECRNNKYRYWLTDFLFVPYEKNRYGVFVPANGVEIPLEKALSKLDKKELDGYLDQTGTFCKQTGAYLQSYMLQTRQAEKPKPAAIKKIITNKW
jgi:hypothetical protein